MVCILGLFGLATVLATFQKNFGQFFSNSSGHPVKYRDIIGKNLILSFPAVYIGRTNNAFHIEERTEKGGVAAWRIARHQKVDNLEVVWAVYPVGYLLIWQPCFVWQCGNE